MSIKDKLKNNEIIYYLYYCVHRMHNPYFRKKVLTMDLDPFVMHNMHYGSEHLEQIYYEIIVGDETKGFCSAIRDTLFYLLYTDAMGFEPHISYTDNMPYHEIHAVNGKENVFEYYFEQPCSINEKELHSCAKVIATEPAHWRAGFILSGYNFPSSYYSNTPEDIELCAKMYQKYFVLNEAVKRNLETDIAGMLRHRTIGVHYRGTDFKVGYNNHPVVIKQERHIETVKQLMNNGEYEYVFLATEDNDIIGDFENVFGKQLLLYQGIVRGSGKINAYNIKSTRENHHYLLGYEVLRDVYTLAACDALVSSLSGVGITTQIIKKSLGKEFESVDVISEGLNSSKKVLQKYK